MKSSLKLELFYKRYGVMMKLLMSVFLLSFLGCAAPNQKRDMANDTDAPKVNVLTLGSETLTPSELRGLLYKRPQTYGMGKIVEEFAQSKALLGAKGTETEADVLAGRILATIVQDRYSDAFDSDVYGLFNQDKELMKKLKALPEQWGYVEIIWPLGTGFSSRNASGEPHYVKVTYGREGRQDFYHMGEAEKAELDKLKLERKKYLDSISKRLSN